MQFQRKSFTGSLAIRLSWLEFLAPLPIELHRRNDGFLECFPIDAVQWEAYRLPTYKKLCVDRSSKLTVMRVGELELVFILQHDFEIKQILVFQTDVQQNAGSRLQCPEVEGDRVHRVIGQLVLLARQLEGHFIDQIFVVDLNVGRLGREGDFMACLLCGKRTSLVDFWNFLSNFFSIVVGLVGIFHPL